VKVEFQRLGKDQEAEGREGLTRRSLLRMVSATGIAALGMSVPSVLAQTPTIEPDPEPDPVAEGSPAAGGDLTVYSGRNETLVGALIEEAEDALGIDMGVRYGGTAELAATILEEGGNSPAGLFFAQDAGALGALAKEGRLQPLPQEILDRVDQRFRSPEGLWVGTSARARVLVYNTEQLNEEELPPSVFDLTDERWKGQIGWAPENGSFQAFITAMRLLQGEDETRQWLEAMIANEPVAFESNGPIVRAVAAGEISAGLVNHYYKYEIQAEEKTELPVENHFFASGDPGSLVNVAGVGVLADAENAEQAIALVDYLLTQPAQAYFSERTFEYPLIDGVSAVEELRPLQEIESPEIDLSDLDDLQGTLALLSELGLI
jgi:iron(III) transport system substrate-binding protein